MNSNCYCNICLERNNILINANDLDNNSTKWSTKIKCILPELELNEDYLICKNCTLKLDDFFEFKRLLVSLLERWKNRQNSLQNVLLVEHSDNFKDKTGNNSNSFLIKEQPIISLKRQKETTLRDKVDEYKKEQNFIVPEVDTIQSVEESNSRDTFDKVAFTEYKCNVCFNSYTSQADLGKHRKDCKSYILLKDQSANLKEKKHAKPRGRKTKLTVSCEICGDTFNYIKHLLEHCLASHSVPPKHVKPYKCIHCSNRFATLTTLNQHLKYHEKKRSEICTVCGKTFITANDLLVHEYTHLNKRNYKCTQCDKAFNTNKNLRTHILVVHTDPSQWKYHCSICGKRFPLKVNYDQHCRRHNGEKFHVCHFCGKSFVSNSELKRHIELHSNIKRFKCVSCNKDYKSRRTFKVHMDNKHSNGQYKAPVREKKFICHICPSQFYDKPKLLRHLCSHSGLKPFGCSLCGKRFTDKTYLKHHVKIAHKVVDSAVYLNICTI